MVRTLIITGAAIALLYFAYIAYFYVNQRALLFPRHFITVPTTVPVVPGMEQMWLETSEGRVEAWYLAPLADEGDRPAPLLLLAHGNGDLIDFWLSPTLPLRQQGFGVLLVEYPGYGRSQGAPSYAAIRQTFLLAYDIIIRHPQVDPQRIILFGHSIGGGAVNALAAERPSAGMILLSTFSSIPHLARDRGLPGFAALDTFDNLATVQEYTAPMLLIHGKADSTIPYQHSVVLHEAAQQGQLVLLECGHGGCIEDWSRFWHDLTPFFERAGVLP